MRIRTALPTDAAPLSQLALSSKAHWGYSEAFMAACRAELTYSPAQLSRAEACFWLLESDDGLLGFYVLVESGRNSYELEALFVAPEHIGKGYGRLLINHALDQVGHRGGGQLQVQSDPNAAAFYAEMGAVETGSSPSASIPGRVLPLFTFRVEAGPQARPE